MMILEQDCKFLGVYRRKLACAALWTNQMGYITLMAQSCQGPCPQATPLDSGQLTAINPRQLGYNYYLCAIPKNKL